MSDQTTPLFDKLYSLSDAATKLMKKPLVERKIRRALASAWDYAEDDKIKAEENLGEKRKDFKDYDVNQVLRWIRDLERYSEVQNAIETEYLKMFGESLKTK